MKAYLVEQMNGQINKDGGSRTEKMKPKRQFALPSFIQDEKEKEIVNKKNVFTYFLQLFGHERSSCKIDLQEKFRNCAETADLKI